MRYHFGTGRGPVHRHASPADLDLPGGAVDGRPDAVRLDFDGDGRADDALWDTDGDGTADRALLDLDDDGRPERAFTDPSGRGVWDAPADVALRPLRFTDVRGRAGSARPEIDTDGDGVPDGAVVDVDHDPSTQETVCDLDGDGVGEELLVDADGDGLAERAYTTSDVASPRWDVLLSDVDRDGAAEVVVTEGAAGWLPP
ncbi:hypothetical protein HH311_27215 [Actinomycetospora sp. TBRC 11914]|nr:hypothetical protein [Actinomycetospora sp. TBRC 11914]